MLNASVSGLVPMVLQQLIAGLLGHPLGEVTGDALGPGDAAQQRLKFELSRCRHVVKEDRIAEGIR